MPRKAASKAHRSGSVVRAAIAVLAVLVLARTAWLASGDGPQAEPAAAAVTPVASSLSAGPASGRSEEAMQQAEIQRLVAQVAMVCPSSALELRRELITVAPAHELAAHRSPAGGGSITSIRVAQRPAQVAAKPAPAGGEWLVDPGQWYVPEDASRDTAADSQATTEEPVDSQPASPIRLPVVPEVVGDAANIPDSAETANSAVAETEDPVFAPELEKDAQSPAGEKNPVSMPPAAELQLELPVADGPEAEPAPDAAPRVTPESWPEPSPAVTDARPEALPDPAKAEPRQPLFAPPVAPSEPALAAPQPVVPEPIQPGAVGPQSAGPFAPPALPSPHSPHSLDEARAKAAAAGIAEGVDPHAELYAEGCFPSAKTCAKCHEKIYHEWSTSSHAYAFVSPMFHKFEQKISELSQGTVGYFCQRCHSPVGTSLNIPRDMPLWEQPEVAREGVTCVACHRVNQRYAKSNGERHIVPGDEFAPVYGGKGGVGVAEAIRRKDEYKLKTSPDEAGPGQPIHVEGRYFDQISQAEYCTTCHQVAVHPGIKLEVVWEQYRASPARKAGITCQDCHMGKEPGIASGYEYCAVAEIAGKTVRDNVKHSNHMFYGPGYSIAHPGIFPLHLKADRWRVDQWLLFDWRAGWGTDAFEEALDAGEIHVAFPPVWAEADDRYDAREIIDDNLKKLATKTEVRKAVMENGSHVDGPFFDTQPGVGSDLNLHYIVSNTNSGHNLPTASLGAQPQLWANVVLIGPRGERLWETGYTDSYGDVCDIHSRDVRAGRVPFDSQLFNLQTMFLITGAVGTDREFYLPVNVDFDQLPFLRPGALPISVLNHPPFIRMESRSIAPLGQKKVKYRIPGHLLRQPGRYRLSFRMRNRAEPIYFMDFCGATIEMQRAMNEGMIDVHPYSVEFDVR